jgi:hypothetical protein
MKSRLWPLALTLAPLFGCTDRQDFWQPQHDLLPMAALDDRVAFVERNTQTAFVLDPADPSLTPLQVPVGKAPVTAVKRQGANQLLVLTKGDRGSASEVEVPAELDVIDALAPAAARYPLTGRFDAVAQSDDGRFALLYHSPAGQAQSDSALFNPNEMTLVDFTPPANPTVPALTAKTIRSLGGVPTKVAFSPLFAFQLGPRTLAVVLSQNYVTLLDLNHPSNTEISVPLCPQSTGCTLTPEQVVFDPSNLNIYVRVTGAKDIYQITLTDVFAETKLAPTAPSNDFVASLSMLAVGSTASDMALYGTGKNNTRLAVASADARTLVIIDPSTSRATPVTTTIPVTKIVPFIRPAQSATDKARQQALLVDDVRGSTSVIFADLEQVETTGGLSLTDYALGAAAADVRPLVDQGIVVLLAKQLAGNAAVTVVDLASRSFSVWGSGSYLSSPTFESRSPSRLWSVDSSTGLCYLNLAPRAAEPSMMTKETWLDQPIADIVPLTSISPGTTTRYLVVRHNDPASVGNLTLLDAEAPTRASARTAYGFLLTNYLDRGQP